MSRTTPTSTSDSAHQYGCLKVHTSSPSCIQHSVALNRVVRSVTICEQTSLYL